MFRRADRETDMTKLIDAFRNFANALIIVIVHLCGCGTSSVRLRMEHDVKSL